MCTSLATPPPWHASADFASLVDLIPAAFYVTEVGDDEKAEMAVS